MEDSKIVDLYWQRSEQAISETKIKYENLLYSVAKNILSMHEDVEECLSDTYLGAWNAMPKARPKYLSAFLCRIAKNQALKKYEYMTAEKRNRHVEVPLSEMERVLVGTDKEFEEKVLAKAISTFLRQESYEKRNIFLRRYFFYDSIEDIAKRFQMKPNTVKSTLRRTRNRLKIYLEKEGFYVGI